MRTLIVVLVVLGAITACRRSADAADPKEAARIQELIGQLDSDAFAERDRAAKELEALGPAALPALRRVLKSSPPLDLQRRVESLVRSIEDLELAAKLRAPGRVRLILKEASVADAVAELAKQCGQPLHLSDEAKKIERKVTLD